MSSADWSQPYDAIADLYMDAFEQTGAFLSLVERLVPRALEPEAKVLDACCGTGGLAAAIAARGPAVVGIDASSAMIARARSRSAKVDFRHIDVRALSDVLQYDVVLSTFDSLNHLVDPLDLDRVFRGVRRALKPRGAFLFDLNSEEGFASRWGGSFTRTVGEEEVVFTFSYDGGARLGVCRVRGESGRTIDIQERCYPEAYVEERLRAAGFSETRYHDSTSLLWPESGRVFFVAGRGD